MQLSVFSHDSVVVPFPSLLQNQLPKHPQIACLKTWCPLQQVVFFPSTSICKSKNASATFGFRPKAYMEEKAPSVDSPAKALRQILESPGIHQGPACFDALSAKLVERAGFNYCFTSGFSVSAARLGLPDVGFISYGEMVDQGRHITEAVSIPVIGDGDNGYGNAMNVKRTVKGFIKAGFAGIILEDQVSPKACGHTQGRKVVPREEAVMRIKAAIDARNESKSDIVIVARTDSRQAVSLEESLWRSRAFADAGADVIFIDALASREEMKALCDISPLLPKMANMLEGGGKTPILTPLELEEIGFKLVSYPLSLIGVSIQAMQDALVAIKGGRLPPPGTMASFNEIKEIVGFNAFYEEEKRYATTASRYQRGYSLASRDGYNIQAAAQDDTEQQRGDSSKDGVVEVITPYVYDDKYRSNESKGPFSGIWSRSLRIKITGKDEFVKLDVRIPAGFIEGFTDVIQGVGGINLKELLDDVTVDVDLDGNVQRGRKLLDFVDTMGDRIEVFLE